MSILYRPVIFLLSRTKYGGHCYQQSELLFSALSAVGFTVTRVASWVLMGSEYQEGAPHNHNILLVTLGDSLYLLDPGLASASPKLGTQT